MNSGKKNISILTYSLASGGAERVISILINKLHKTFNITLFLLNDTLFYDIPDSIKIIYLDQSKPNEHGIIKLFKIPFLALKYKKLNTSPISVSFMYRPNYINVLAHLFGMKSKTIINERSFPSYKKSHGLPGKINLILINWLYKRAEKVVTNALISKYDLQKNFNVKHATTIYNPFNINQITLKSQQNIKFNPTQFSFITIGRLDEEKNQTLMIKAMSHISGTLYIIGHGHLEKKLKKLIKHNQLESKVILLGKQKNPFQYLAKADCFLLTSNCEGFPNALVEALACNLPVISTDCQSGPREILAPNSDIFTQLTDTIEYGEYGILTPVNNETQLIKAMNAIMMNTELQKKYSQKAQTRAQDFDATKIIKKYETILCAK